MDSDSNPQPATPAARPFLRTHEEVMFFDTDCGGVVHNLAYLRFIETNRTRLAVQLGMDLRGMVASQIYPVLVHTDARYLLPAALGDWVTIDGAIDSLRGARFWCRFVVRRPADGALLVRARQELALVSMPAGKPVRLPGMWRSQLGSLPPLDPDWTGPPLDDPRPATPPEVSAAPDFLS